MSADLRALIFALNSFAAAMAALFISFRIGLEKPFWAMLSAYIASQPMTGAVRSKALYRFLGTLIGVVGAVALVPNLVNDRMMLVTGMSLWLGVNLFISLLDRSPSSYVFMLAGYTAGIVGFPNLDAPDDIFNQAILRAQEIGIGVLCAVVFHTVFFPVSVLDALHGKVRTLTTAMVAWTESTLSLAPAQDASHHPSPGYHALLNEISGMQMLSNHVAYETVARWPSRRMLGAVQDQFTLLVPLISALDDRLTALRDLGPLDPDLTEYVESLRDRIAIAGRSMAGDATTTPGEDEVRKASSLRSHGENLLQTRADHTSWKDLLEANLVLQSLYLLDEIRRLDHLLRLTAKTIPPTPQRLARALGKTRPRPLHRDYGVAFLSAFSAAATLFLFCLFWIMTAWPHGAAGAMMGPVALSFFAAQDDPRPLQTRFLFGQAAGVVMAFIYQARILPFVHTFETLALVLLPSLLAIGVVMFDARFFATASAVMIGFLGALAISPHYAVDFSLFLNNNISLLAGIFAAWLGTGVMRVIGAEVMTLRLRRASWRAIARLGEQPEPPDPVAWTNVMLDRMVLISTRARLIQSSDHTQPQGSSLRDVRVGLNIVHLRTAIGGYEPALRLPTMAIIRDISQYYRRLAREAAISPPAERLREEIDRLLDTIAARRAISGADHDQERRTLDLLLVGLRRNFFPDAPPYTPHAGAPA